MRLIKPSYKIESEIDQSRILNSIEKAGRVCYKSEHKIDEDSAKKFVAKLIKSGHESVIEHESITVRFICDRGVSHELVRHRLASYSQESTRYVKYNDVEFIEPCWEIGARERVVFNAALRDSERSYSKLIDAGWKPQQARAVLNNAVKTEIVMTANLRQWREVLKQRTHKTAHPQMRELMVPLLEELKRKLPVIFGGINE